MIIMVIVLLITHLCTADFQQEHVSGAIIFLAVTWQLNRTHCLSLASLLALTPLTIRVFTTLQSEPRDLWPLRHLIRVMRRHDLTKNTYLPTYLHTYPPTYLPTSITTTRSPPGTGDFYFWQPKSDPRDLWPLIHLMRVIRRHDLNEKYLPTFIPTHLPTYLPMYLH